MKRLLTTLTLGVCALIVTACGEDGPEKDHADDTGSGEIPEDHAVDEDTLDTLASIIESVDDAYGDWEGRMLINTVVVEDAGSEDGARNIESRVHTDGPEERFYIETLDVSDSQSPKTLHYLYVEDGIAYVYESAAQQEGPDSEERYEKMDKGTIEDTLPDIDAMFDQIFQYFPSDKESAEIQGMTLLEASVDLDKDATVYEADVNVLMQSGNGGQNEEVWSLFGSEGEVTVEMPMPSLGTFTFREIDFDEVVDGIEKDRHTWSEDEGTSENAPDGEDTS